MPRKRLNAGGEVDGTSHYYKENASKYFSETIDIDMRATRARFLQHLPKSAFILDAGSGSGRDTKAFLDLGYRVEAFDASSALARLSSNFTCMPTNVLRFEEFRSPARFDGIWACASLLHIEESTLPSVIGNLRNALKIGGVLYASFRAGRDGSVSHDGRHYTNMTKSKLRSLFGDAVGFKVIELWTSPERSDLQGGREWENVLATKTSA